MLKILINFLLSLLNSSKQNLDVTLVKSSLIQEPIMQPTEYSKQEFKIVQKFLNPKQYVQDSKTVYNQICLHHTAGSSADSTIEYWKSNTERVATSFIIDRDGTVIQCLPLEKAWAYHLYVASPGNRTIDRKYKKLGSQYDKQCIGIELCNRGQVTPYEDKFIDSYGKVFPKDKIIELDKPHRGFKYYEQYTKEQVESLENLLIYLLAQFPKIANSCKSKDNYEDIFDINLDALNMIPGIYTHDSYRQDKVDCYKDPNLLSMLNNLKNKI